MLPTGQLDLHGRLFSPTWTRLSASALAGATSITLQSAVNWQPGQLVAIPTSIYRDVVDGNQNEVLTVASVSPDGRTLTFTTPLRFNHYGGEEYQTEVVLLSRTILLRSSEETEATKIGAHVRVEGQVRSVIVIGREVSCRQSQRASGHLTHWLPRHAIAQGRIEGTLAYRLGQLNVIGAYPFHWHMVGEVNSTWLSYIKDSSVFHGYFRCE